MASLAPFVVQQHDLDAPAGQEVQVAGERLSLPDHHPGDLEVQDRAAAHLARRQRGVHGGAGVVRPPPGGSQRGDLAVRHRVALLHPLVVPGFEHLGPRGQHHPDRDAALLHASPAWPRARSIISASTCMEVTLPGSGLGPQPRAAGSEGPGLGVGSARGYRSLAALVGHRGRWPVSAGVRPPGPLPARGGRSPGPGHRARVGSGPVRPAAGDRRRAGRRGSVPPIAHPDHHPARAAPAAGVHAPGPGHHRAGLLDRLRRDQVPYVRLDRVRGAAGHDRGRAHLVHDQRSPGRGPGRQLWLWLWLWSWRWSLPLPGSGAEPAKPAAEGRRYPPRRILIHGGAASTTLILALITLLITVHHCPRGSRGRAQMCQFS